MNDKPSKTQQQRDRPTCTSPTTIGVMRSLLAAADRMEKPLKVHVERKDSEDLGVGPRNFLRLGAVT